MPTNSPSRRPPTPFETAATPQRTITGEAPADVFLFEIAWEVCNLVGGIYQVVRSKVPLMTARWQDHYCMIGPYFEQKAQLEFEPSPPSGWMARVIARV